MIVNCINLRNRVARLESFKNQAAINNFDFRVWEGETESGNVCTNISNAHKKIIKDAKECGLNQVCVAEDDVIFFEGGWKYFIGSIPEKYSIFLSMIYEGEIDESNRIVKNISKTPKINSFSGLTCYIVHESFYETFLSMNPEKNLDRALGEVADRYEFYVANPFIAYQANGFSDNAGVYCDYDRLLEGRKLFGR